MQGKKRGAAYFFGNRKARGIMSEKSKLIHWSRVENKKETKSYKRGQEVPHYLKKSPKCKVLKEELPIFQNKKARGIMSEKSTTIH